MTSEITRWVVGGEPKDGNLGNHKMLTSTKKDPISDSDWVKIENSNIIEVHPLDSKGTFTWHRTNDVKCGNNLWVAVGKGRYVFQDFYGYTKTVDRPIIISNDGIHWRTAKVPYIGWRNVDPEYQKFDGYSVDYNGTCWIMCGDSKCTDNFVVSNNFNGIMMRSFDGETWERLVTTTSIGNHTLYNVKWLGNRWVAIGKADLNIANGENSKVIISNDVDGSNWSVIPWTSQYIPHRLAGDSSHIYIMTSDAPSGIYSKVNAGEWNYDNPAARLGSKRRSLELLDTSAGMQYFAVGEGEYGCIIRSYDPVYWWGASTGFTPVANAINSYKENVLVGGDQGELGSSINGGINFRYCGLTSGKRLKRINGIGYSLST